LKDGLYVTETWEPAWSGCIHV